METTLRQLPHFLRQGELYNNLTDGDYNLDDPILVPIIVNSNIIDNIKDFENIIVAEDFWDTFNRTITLYVYALFHRSEVIEFLTPLAENNLASELLDEITSGSFIIDNKVQLLKYIKKIYPDNLEMYQELKDTSIFILRNKDENIYDGPSNFYINTELINNGISTAEFYVCI